jgi:hypothetical protein
MKSNVKRTNNKTSGIMVLILSAIYLLFSIGVIKATHFCMGKEASVAYFTSETEKCSCSIFAAEGHYCCDDAQDLIKLEDWQKSLSTFVLTGPAWTALGDIYNLEFLVQSNAPERFQEYTADSQPPPKILFKFHCSFVFYDKNLTA